MKISFILIHYHTPELLERAVSAIRSDVSASKIDSEIIVIDNGSRPEDVKLFKSLQAEFIDPGSNLGYAGGVNLGIKNASGDIFVLMNPDVQILPGCTKSLVDALAEGYSAAGPRFYLDSGKEVLLPPLVELTYKNEILWRLSALSEDIAKRARNEWRKHAKEQLNATSPVLNYNLTGALIAVTREAWDSVGTFDETFKLYFEELDWLMRLKKKGLRACFVPSAQAIHKVSQSASRESRSAEWYKESLAIYRRRYYGAFFTFLLEKAVPLIRNAVNIKESSPETGYMEQNPEIDIAKYKGPLYVEISDSELGIPALCVPLTEKSAQKWRLSDISWDLLQPGIYNLRLVDEEGEELEHLRFKR